MPRSLRFHPFSLALGAVACGLALYLASAAPLAGPTTLRIDGIPAVSQMVRLEATDLPYTVPAGTSLVITGAGLVQTCGNADGAWTTILFDAVGIIGIDLDNSGFNGSYQVLWPGVAAPSGTLVDVCGQGNYQHTVLLGYLTRD